jgi:hypothetical protein
MEPQAGLDRQADQTVALSSTVLAMYAVQRPADLCDCSKKRPPKRGKILKV